MLGLLASLRETRMEPSHQYRGTDVRSNTYIAMSATEMIPWKFFKALPDLCLVRSETVPEGFQNFFS